MTSLTGRGRKRKTTARADKSIIRKAKADRRKSASTIKKEINNELSVTISDQTVQSRINESGLNDRVTRKKPFVNKKNQN